MASLSEQFFDVTTRVQQIIHLETMVVDDIDGDLFDTLTEGANMALAKALGVDDLDSILNEYGSSNYDQNEALREAIIWKPLKGWLVQASTPVRTKTGSGSLMFSWGYYTSQWFYNESYEAAITEILEWGKSEEDAALTSKGDDL